ncbi:MAG: DUF4124 domain-containing protein [Gammaproteobacteria bacterium]|nr:MAG: DUF4124 domain-containing protein [Gammaproteobacteria bacterium]
MKYALLLLCGVLVSAHAEVYRWVDKSGTVIYSDQPHPDAELVDIQTSPSYTPVAIPEQALSATEDVQDEIEVPAYQIKIVSPENDVSIRDNAGTVTISVDVVPELDVDRADQLTVKLDGQTLSEPQSSTSFTLTNIERGTHTAQVSIVDKSSNTLQSSQIVTFHLQRHSLAQ